MDFGLAASIELNGKTEFNKNNKFNLLSKPRYTTSYVIKKGYFNLVRCLLSLGSDPNYVSEKETLSRTSLIYATFIKDDKWAVTIARNLLEYGANLRQTDSNLLSPIHYCCAFGRDNLLEIFLNSLDFDISKSVDLNGNSCMHYAIRSQNLKCVNLLIKKFKYSYLEDKLNMKNIFGLRPIDIEYDYNYNLKENLINNGNESLEDCKTVLKNFIKVTSQLKLIEKEIKTKQESDAEEYLKKNQKGKKKKISQSIKKAELNSAEKLDSVNSLDCKDLIELTTSQIFKTQIDENEFKENIKPKNTSSMIDMKFDKSLKQTSSNFNHASVSKSRQDSDKLKQEKKTKSCNFLSPNPNLKPSESKSAELDLYRIQSPEIIYDKKTAINLTLKSFLISFKDLTQNYLEYNNLFYAKEHMIQSGLENKNDKNSFWSSAKLKKFNFYSNNSLDNNKKLPTLNTSTIKKDWKKEFPQVFNVFENHLTSSYRDSAHPPVNKKLKNNQKQFLDMKAQAKRVATQRRKKSKTIIIRNSLSTLSMNPSTSEITTPPNGLSDESSVFEYNTNILPLNSNTYKL